MPCRYRSLFPRSIDPAFSSGLTFASGVSKAGLSVRREKRKHRVRLGARCLEGGGAGVRAGFKHSELRPYHSQTMLFARVYYLIDESSNPWEAE